MIARMTKIPNRRVRIGSVTGRPTHISGSGWRGALQVGDPQVVPYWERGFLRSYQVAIGIVQPPALSPPAAKTPRKLTADTTRTPIQTPEGGLRDRKSTRLNYSHMAISYAFF